VRLEKGPPLKGVPSVTLRFDALNDSSADVTDILLEVAIVRKPSPEGAPEVIAGPYAIRGAVVLRPGFSPQLRDAVS
jgi:hypothetical protein